MKPTAYAAGAPEARREKFLLINESNVAATLFKSKQSRLVMEMLFMYAGCEYE